MIRDFKITDEFHIGYYASLITSAFAMAQFVSGTVIFIFQDDLLGLTTDLIVVKTQGCRGDRFRTESVVSLLCYLVLPQPS